MIIINDFQLLTIITKRSILDFAAVLDPPLRANIPDHLPGVSYSFWMLQMIAWTCQKLPPRDVLYILKINGKLIKIKVKPLENTCKISQF